MRRAAWRRHLKYVVAEGQAFQTVAPYGVGRRLDVHGLKAAVNLIGRNFFTAHDASCQRLAAALIDHAAHDRSGRTGDASKFSRVVALEGTIGVCSTLDQSDWLTQPRAGMERHGRDVRPADVKLDDAVAA